MILPWKKIDDRVDYDCGFFKVRVQKSLSPITGKEHPFYVLDTHDWVNVIALTPDKKVLLVSQFRHGSQALSVEIPGGAVDRKDASPLAAARRELLEETGHEASQWFSLGAVRPNPAILNNQCHFFLATGAKRVADLHLDEAEELECDSVPLLEIPARIRDGRISHALVIAAFQLLELFRKENPDKL
jgi:ADP-ribose pyrophosphatase